MKSLRLLLCSLLPAMLAAAAQAETTQTVTVDGVEEDAQITRLTFSGGDVTMTFADGSMQTADMQTVVVTFSYDGDGSGTGISVESAADSESGEPAVFYTVGGQYAGSDARRLKRGIYISNRKTYVIR